MKPRGFIHWRNIIKMKRVKKPVFFIIAALILVLSYTAIFGVYTQNGDTKNTWIKGVSDIRWGIDIRGGVEATFSPADGIDATAEQLEAAKAIIELRMVSKLSLIHIWRDRHRGRRLRAGDRPENHAVEAGARPLFCGRDHRRRRLYGRL